MSGRCGVRRIDGILPESILLEDRTDGQGEVKYIDSRYTVGNTWRR